MRRKKLSKCIENKQLGVNLQNVSIESTVVLVFLHLNVLSSTQGSSIYTHLRRCIYVCALTEINFQELEWVPKWDPRWMVHAQNTI